MGQNRKNNRDQLIIDCDWIGSLSRLDDRWYSEAYIQGGPKSKPLPNDKKSY